MLVVRGLHLRPSRTAEGGDLVSLSWMGLRGGLNFAAYPHISPRENLSESIRMAITNPVQFLQQVRAEVGKVVWPTRREVVLTTIMVFVLTAVIATFFTLVDLAIRSGLTAILTMFD